MSDRFERHTKLKDPMRVNGAEVPVYVSAFGTFFADFGDDDWCQADTYAGLHQKVVAVLTDKLACASVPFITEMDSGWLRTGICRGIHAGTGDFLVTWSDGSNDRASRTSEFIDDAANETVLAEHNELSTIISDARKRRQELYNSLPKFHGQEMAIRIRAAK